MSGGFSSVTIKSYALVSHHIISHLQEFIEVFIIITMPCMQLQFISTSKWPSLLRCHNDKNGKPAVVEGAFHKLRAAMMRDIHARASLGSK